MNKSKIIRDLIQEVRRLRAEREALQAKVRRLRADREALIAELEMIQASQMEEYARRARHESRNESRAMEREDALRIALCKIEKAQKRGDPWAFRDALREARRLIEEG